MGFRIVIYPNGDDDVREGKAFERYALEQLLEMQPLRSVKKTKKEEWKIKCWKDQ